MCPQGIQWGIGVVLHMAKWGHCCISRCVFPRSTSTKVLLYRSATVHILVSSWLQAEPHFLQSFVKGFGNSFLFTCLAETFWGATHHVASHQKHGKKMWEWKRDSEKGRETRIQEQWLLHCDFSWIKCEWQVRATSVCRQRLGSHYTPTALQRMFHLSSLHKNYPLHGREKQGHNAICTANRKALHRKYRHLDEIHEYQKARYKKIQKLESIIKYNIEC